MGGRAGPAGRPISMATFLLDREAWPDDPARFKRTNVLLHLLCGLLLGWLALQCARALKLGAERASWLATLASGLWLLHPLWVSTTLYVVQRMTILSALFQLAGLTAYVAQRRRLAAVEASQIPVRLTALAAILGSFTILAFLCKENGALLPLLALVLEVTVLRNVSVGPSPKWFRAWALTVLGTPAIAIVGYLVHVAVTAGTQSISYRGFTIAERALTECRILAQYLWAIIVPRLETTGIYHDDVPVSTGLLHPPTTAASLLLIVLLLILAW